VPARTPDIREQVEAYAAGVLSGEIVAGKWVRLACQRFVDDLANESLPYRMNWETAENACLMFPVVFRHYKGEWEGQPIELCPFQVFVTANIMGWIHKETKLRRFRKAFVSVARKNGKTTWAAGLAILFAFFDGEAAAEVYIGATKKEQAAILFQDANAMIRRSETLSQYAQLHKPSITFPKTDSLIRPLGSDRPYDGLNPHCTIKDELHAWTEQHRKFYDTMRTGGGARRQPLDLTITTAGDDKSSIWLEEIGYGRMVVEGQLRDDELFFFLCEIDEEDDPLDPSVWAKSNPGLGYSVKLDYLEGMAKEARASQTAFNRFKRYHGNTQTSSTEQAIDVAKWDELGSGLSDWNNADAITAAFDLGGRDDLAAYALVARFIVGEDEENEQPIYRYECRTTCFLFSDTKRDLDKEPYQSFIRQGLIHVERFAIDSLRDRLIEDCKEHGIEYVAFDPYQAQHLAGTA
jgi:phage terminase large subunit-like protein